MLSPLLYSLFTHDCTTWHDSNTIIKFADDTTMVGLITNNDETAYREEVRDLTVWCKDNNLSLIKTKEMIVYYRKKRTEHAPIIIDGAVVEQVESFKFLGVHITNKLTWSKKCLFPFIQITPAHFRLFEKETISKISLFF